MCVFATWLYERGELHLDSTIHNTDISTIYISLIFIYQSSTISRLLAERHRDKQLNPAFTVDSLHLMLIISEMVNDLRCHFNQTYHYCCQHLAMLRLRCSSKDAALLRHCGNDAALLRVICVICLIYIFRKKCNVLGRNF